MFPRGSRPPAGIGVFEVLQPCRQGHRGDRLCAVEVWTKYPHLDIAQRLLARAQQHYLPDKERKERESHSPLQGRAHRLDALDRHYVADDDACSTCYFVVGNVANERRQPACAQSQSLSSAFSLGISSRKNLLVLFVVESRKRTLRKSSDVLPRACQTGKKQHTFCTVTSKISRWRQRCSI